MQANRRPARAASRFAPSKRTHVPSIARPSSVAATRSIVRLEVDPLAVDADLRRAQNASIPDPCRFGQHDHIPAGADLNVLLLQTPNRAEIHWHATTALQPDQRDDVTPSGAKSMQAEEKSP